ncbi:hypothetical protein [Massilia consociata]|uniref:AgmX/PglI C-terminal domain-containing protein n=1 Tax=Massilia consociata TaxID=760117 RepID=A0ABV6FIU1_9BURK
MRYTFALAAAALWASTAFADEPATCYVPKDPTGDFVSGKVQPFDADPHTAAQVVRLLNQDNRANGRCFHKFIEREGGMPSAAGILYGARVSPAGKVTQVSVLGTREINDAMLMACLARSICQWELKASADGKERLLRLPPQYTNERSVRPELRTEPFSNLGR